MPRLAGGGSSPNTQRPAGEVVQGGGLSAFVVSYALVHLVPIPGLKLHRKTGTR